MYQPILEAYLAFGALEKCLDGSKLSCRPDWGFCAVNKAFYLLLGQLNAPFDDRQGGQQLMADEAEGFLHAALRFTHCEFVCLRLRPFLLQLHALKSEHFFYSEQCAKR